MSHTCKALVINCMDFRFHSAIRDFLVSLGLKDQYDLVSVAGSSKGLAQNEPGMAEVLLTQVELSSKLHGTTDVYLVHHMDCGAYGGHAAFASLPAEEEKQRADMEASKRRINERFSSLNVRQVLARISETGAIDFRLQ